MRITAILAIAAAALAILPASAGQWQQYVNPRFGTAAEIPVSGFRALPPPDNGDGQEWEALDGSGRFSISGQFLIPQSYDVDRDFDDLRKLYLQIEKDDGVTITYSAAGKGWFAFSGTKGDKIIYDRTHLNRDCELPIVDNFYATYKASARDLFDPLVTHVAHSLKGTKKGSDC
ncbi:MAG: hypothetical protein Q9M41_12005 [Paracoccaceae bacterium]|nr:hypothetical protein [Paracoccaceae bacterium]